MNITGEIALSSNEVQSWTGSGFAIAFGGGTLDDFKKDLEQFPQEAVDQLTDKPVKYCCVDWGHPDGAKLSYLDIYKNFKFFIFNDPNDIRWYQRSGRNYGFFRMNSGGTPNDMFKMLRGGESGLQFIGFFYGRIKAEARRGGRDIQTIWITDASGSSSANPIVQGRQDPDAAYKRRCRNHIVGTIYQRLKDEIVGKWQIARPITKNSDRNVILAGWKTSDRYGRSIYRRHTIRNPDARRLANSFDDWHWLDNPANPRAQEALATLTRIMDPSGIELPPKEYKQMEFNLNESLIRRAERLIGV